MNQKQRKEDIISAAYRLFQEQGFDEVSINDICKVCKITKPTFYKYIESKEELLLHFYEGLGEILLDELMERRKNDDFFEQTYRGMAFYMEKSVEFGHDLYSRYLQYIYHTHNPASRFNNDSTPLTLDAIAKAQESGQIRNTSDPALIYLTGRCLCLGLSSQWCFGPGDFDLPAAFRKSFEELVQPNWEKINACQTQKSSKS